MPGYTMAVYRSGSVVPDELACAGDTRRAALDEFGELALTLRTPESALLWAADGTLVAEFPS